MDLWAIVIGVGALVGIIAGIVQVLEYLQRWREKRVSSQGQQQPSVVTSPQDPFISSQHPNDVYVPYEAGLGHLLVRLGRDHPRYREALTYEQRLRYNIAETRRHGDTETREAERSGIIEQLNGLALSELGLSFNELCRQTYPSTSAVQESTQPSIPQNLPARSEFVGREAEKAQVHQSLRSRSRVVIIDGIGGIGKTALTLEVAHECLDASQDGGPNASVATFDGFIWTTAKDRDLSLNDILDTVARILERPHIAEKPAAEKELQIRKLLRANPYLLVVDSLEMITDENVRDFLLKLPEPSRALITTRERDLTEARMISLEDLKEAEALELIRSEGKRLSLTAVERADDEVLSRLYRSTTGAPLAIKWAVGQIGQRGQSLDAVSVALQKARATIFESIFDRSWELLSTDAQQVIMVMPLFVASASRAAIAAISDVHDSALDDALGQLVSMSLLDATDELETERRRYSVHPLTRAYAAKAGESEPLSQFVRDAFERMLVYYKQLVACPEELKMGVPYWDGLLNYAGIRNLEQEWPNLSHLIHRALDEGRDMAALDLFLPVVHSLNAWGLWDHRLQLAGEVREAANRLGDSSEAWLWIDAIGWIYWQRQQYRECKDALDRGRVLARRFDLADALLEADAYEARLRYEMGDTDLARQKIETILDQTDLDWVLEHGSRVHRIIIGRIVGVAALLSQSEGDFARAKEGLENELKLRSSVGENVAPILARLGYVSLKLDDTASAEEFLNQAQVNAGPKDVALINYSLALVAEQKNDLREARRLCERALEQYTRLGMERGVQACQELLVHLPDQN